MVYSMNVFQCPHKDIFLDQLENTVAGLGQHPFDGDEGGLLTGILGRQDIPGCIVVFKSLREPGCSQAATSGILWQEGHQC